jgi:hypothetical protein
MKYKPLYLLTAIAFISAAVNAQVTEAEKTLREQTADTLTGWRKGGVLAMTMAQTSLTNWASGGQNSVSLNGRLSLFANYKKENSAWDNMLDIGYGLMQQGKDEPFRKTDDKIDLLSKYGQKAFNKFYYAAMLNFKTQFSPGYNLPNDSVAISKFMAPGYLIAALGLDYKPDNYFSAFFAPVTGKFTFVNDKILSDQGAFGVDPGKTSRSELGGYLRIIYSKNDFKSEFMKNIAFTTKVDLFSNYLDKPQNIDVNWETLIAMKVNKYLYVNLTTQLLYDDNTLIAIDENHDNKTDYMGKRVQFKEIFGAGFSLKF